ncbi:MAG: HAMP domain-containing histidine kinase [Ruminococcaceae bacterium]|nr:HAMP domain-containing histidine kinase [Oscillospiraceae bacterium]
MKLFWKIFCASVLTAAALFSIGGYMLIDRFFSSALDREIDSARDENALLAYTVENNFYGTYSDASAVGFAVGNMSIGSSGQPTGLRLSDRSYSTVFTNCTVYFDTAILRSVSPSKAVYRTEKVGESYYVRVARLITAGDSEYYLESFRDVTDVFEERDGELAFYRWLTIFLVATDAVVMFIVARHFTRPITSMREAARALSRGEMGKRAHVGSRPDTDEVGGLAADFNRMADNLEQNIQELRQSAQRQEDFIGSFAHELKTPLTSMIGYADMLRSRQLEPEQTVMSANYIFQEGKRLEALSLKLMDLLVVRNSEITRRRIRTTELFESVVSVAYPSVVKEEAELSVHCEDAIVSIEPDLMKTVLLNLIDNARKAVDKGGKISFRGEPVDGAYLITVTDNGRGIPPGELERITEAFYMVDKSRSRAKGGAGLGLAVCSEICKLHGTKLEFESTEGKGTTVSVRIHEFEMLSEDDEL